MAAAAAAVKPSRDVVLSEEQLHDTAQMVKGTTCEILNDTDQVIGSAWRYSEHKYGLVMDAAHAHRTVRFQRMSTTPTATTMTLHANDLGRVICPIRGDLVFVIFNRVVDRSVFDTIEAEPDRFFPRLFVTDEPTQIDYKPYASTVSEAEANKLAAQFIIPTATDPVLCFTASSWNLHMEFGAMDQSLYPNGCLVCDTNSDIIAILLSPGKLYTLTSDLRLSLAKACLESQPSDDIRALISGGGPSGTRA